jgi:REP element-mobilizing transposase RayT
MTTPAALVHGQYYHIYNRGNNRENLFKEERNYHYFMNLYARHVEPLADTFAYCLLRNHFHFLVRVKTEEEIQTRKVSETFRVSSPSGGFGKLFNAYAKAVNKAYGRTGSLFQKPFGRALVKSNAHLRRLVVYIHRNPQAHGFVDDFREWPYSSYPAILTAASTPIQRDQVIEWFGDLDQFVSAHDQNAELKAIRYLIRDD